MEALKMKVIPVILIVCLVGAILIAGCTSNTEAQKSEPVIRTPISYGGNVYFFDCWIGGRQSICDESIYGNSLADFIVKHPELEFVDQELKTAGYGGSTHGYFVVFRNKTS